MMEVLRFWVTITWSFTVQTAKILTDAYRSRIVRGQSTQKDVIERYLWNGLSRERLKAMKALYALIAMKALCALYAKYGNVLVEKPTLVKKRKMLNLKPKCIYSVQSIEQHYYRETEEQKSNGCKLLVKIDAMLDSLDAKSGPKDLVIVVDVSGSMEQAGRARLAKAATSAVIDTLEWKDWATVILFNHGIAAQYSQQLRPMLDEERSKMKSWLNDQIWSQGGTDFQTALSEAFAVIERSVSAGDTSMCQKGMLFLTDGEADFTEYDFAQTQRKALQFSVALFTYALGSGAQTYITHRLACENKGIFYQLPDHADFSTAMSKYYEYFASGVELCVPSFTRYRDVVTGAELWPACLPSYDRSSGEQELLGVGCIDLNVMADLERMKSESYWEDFICKLSDLSKQCYHLDLSDCRLEKLKLRRAVGPESSCTDVAWESNCACADPNCQDNANFLDELGYFCDTWVGDDCTRAVEDWGYTAAGQESVLQQCRRSCGRCPQGPCQDGQCQNVEKISSSACRDKLTTRVTPNKITKILMASGFGVQLAWINPWAWLCISLAQSVLLV